MSAVTTSTEHPTSHRGMTHARARLWLGISCVGTQVLVCLTALVFDVPHRFLPQADASLATEFVAAVSFFTIIALTLLPFDIIGGWILPRRFGHSAVSLGRFFGPLVRSISVIVVLFSLLFVVYRSAGQGLGVAGATATFFVVQLLLAAMQLPIARLVAGLRASELAGPVKTVALHARDQGLTGGVVGLPGADVIVIPQSWVKLLPERLIHAAIKRRLLTVRSGKRLTGLGLAIAWNTVCFAVAIQLPGGGVASIAELATAYFYFGLLSFVGLLILPASSRAAVFSVDRLLRQEVPAGDIIALATRLDELAEPEPARSSRLESVFHPIPCVERRRLVLDSDADAKGHAWNSARMALFLSWAFGGPLARSVHCNIGRVELWVLLPTD